MGATWRPMLASMLALAIATTACAADGNTSTAPGAPPPRSRAGASTGTSTGASTGTGTTDQDGRDPRAVGGSGSFVRLTPFADCAAFLDHVKAEARARVGAYGLDTPVSGPWSSDVDMTASDESGATADAVDGSAGAPAPTITGTNVQELGVDEPDVIKTDGDRIVTISNNVLTTVDVSGQEPVVAGSLTLPDGWGHQLFLHGDRAIVLTNAGTWGHPMPVDLPDATIDATIEATADSSWDGRPWQPSATLVEVALDAPGPAIVSTLEIEGQYLNARVVGARLLLAVSTGPQSMPWLYPQTPAGEQHARDTNRAVIDASTLADWLPGFELTTGGTTSAGDLLGCDHVNRPAEFAGFDMISVLGLDLDAGLADGIRSATAEGVLAGGQTVYASLDRLYVATTKWIPPVIDPNSNDQAVRRSEDQRTDLHAFRITSGEPVEYLASGSVDGTLLNSFSLDEDRGYLRVIVTDGTPWNQSDPSETRLTVLAEQGDELVKVGEVGGLGHGEALYSARLIGDRGFAVTFRQVDPFYVLDLSDPTDPRVTGELKIPGFSTYLHPVGEHRVLGIGRAATEEGVVTGLKLSLFDVADPARPTEISTWTLDDAYSAAEYDHHGFQLIGTTAILPVQSYADGFNGAVVFDVADAITEIGRISHTPITEQPTSDCRRLVEGDVPDSSPIYWVTVDPYTRTFLCEQGDRGGYGAWYCDRIAADDLSSWLGVTDDELTAHVANVDLDALDHVERCYPPDPFHDVIQRTLAIDATLWTMSTSTLQANDAVTLAPLAALPIR